MGRYVVRPVQCTGYLLEDDKRHPSRLFAEVRYYKPRRRFYLQPHFGGTHRALTACSSTLYGGGLEVTPQEMLLRTLGDGICYVRCVRW
jgi:hypothetical protein